MEEQKYLKLVAPLSISLSSLFIWYFFTHFPLLFWMIHDAKRFSPLSTLEKLDSFMYSFWVNKVNYPFQSEKIEFNSQISRKTMATLESFEISVLLRKGQNLFIYKAHA